jgi:hypothetical protein
MDKSELSTYFQKSTIERKKTIMEIIDKLSLIQGFDEFEGELWADIINLAESGWKDTSDIEAKIASLVLRSKSPKK